MLLNYRAVHLSLYYCMFLNAGLLKSDVCLLSLEAVCLFIVSFTFVRTNGLLFRP